MAHAHAQRRKWKAVARSGEHGGVRWEQSEHPRSHQPLQKMNGKTGREEGRGRNPAITC